MIKIQNLNNKQIININDLKFKKTFRMTNFAKQIKLRFISQKRMLSTRLTDTEIFDKLDINIKSVLNGSKNNAYIRGYLNTLLTLNNDLKSILTDNSLNLQEKQKNLEKLSQQNQSFDLELQYNVPKVLSKLIDTLDLILLQSGRYIKSSSRSKRSSCTFMEYYILKNDIQEKGLFSHFSPYSDKENDESKSCVIFDGKAEYNISFNNTSSFNIFKNIL